MGVAVRRLVRIDRHAADGIDGGGAGRGSDGAWECAWSWSWLCTWECASLVTLSILPLAGIARPR